jgi:hypothetical protein
MIMQFALYLLFYHCLERTLFECDLVPGMTGVGEWLAVAHYHGTLKSNKESRVHSRRLLQVHQGIHSQFFPLAQINPFMQALSKLCFWPPG